MTQEPSTLENKKQKPSLTQVLVPVAAILAMVLIVFSMLRPAPEVSSSRDAVGSVMGHPPKVGDTLEDLDLKTLQGEIKKLSSVSGKVLLINVWATWCGPCIAEMPSIVKLREKYHSRGFEVIGINVDQDPEEVLRPFEKKFAMNFESFLDREGWFSDRFGVNSIPFSIVIDGSRKVLFVEQGDRDWFADSVQKKVEKWLEGGAA